MRRFTILGAVLTGLLVADYAYAHGGGHPVPYTGPAGRVPPNNQPGGSPKPPPNPTPTPTPGPAPTPSPSPSPSPSPTPAPAPSTGAPARGGAAGVGGAVTRRNKGTGAASYEDWDFWWAYNKEPWLKLKENLFSGPGVSENVDSFFGKKVKAGAKDTARPSAAFLREELIPQLVKTVDDKHPDVADSACVALGKVAEGAEVQKFIDTFSHKNQSVRKAAVIGLGLVESKKAIEPLTNLLRANQAGVKLRGGREPEFGMRAHAAIGIAFAIRAEGDLDGNVGRDALLEYAKDERSNKAIRVNATVALGLLKGDEQYLEPVIAELKGLAKSKRRDDFVRAHAIVALGRVFKFNAKPVDAETMEFIVKLTKRDAVNHVRASGTIALGSLYASHGDKTPEPVLDLLKKQVNGKAKGAGNRERNFAAIALGQIGGDVASKTLSKIARKEKNQKGAFAALALAILASSDSKDQKAAEYKAEALKAIRYGFEKQKNPAVKSGYAIALGMARDTESGDEILKSMKKVSDFEYKGYAAVAMGMIKYNTSVEYLRRVLDNANNQPVLKQQVAIGLGLMGNREVSGLLVKNLAEGKNAYVQSSITKALGYIGDRDAVKPLVEIMVNKKDHQDLTRAFACVALGTIGDDHDIPLLSELFVDHNYLASTSTLVELSRIL